MPALLDRLGAKTDMRARERAAKRYLGEHSGAAVVPDDKAYLRVDGGSLPRFEEVRALALDLHRQKTELAEPLEAGKDYFVPLVDEATFRAHADLFELALDPRVLAPATRYVESLPLLRVMQIYWTPSRPYTPEGSQLYHSDSHDVTGRQLKLFVNLVDVGPDEGPFTFLPADVSERVSAVAERDGKRYSDEVVYGVAERDDAISLLGPAGTAMLVDTNRCLHFGGRSTGRDRLILVAQYIRADRNRRAGHVEPAAVAPHTGDDVAERVLRDRHSR
jgi:hypothetical protein